ncbi:peptidylprolyl isomerase [Ferrimonas balearica]|uniref:peptidylprolyl isomerase n=1 Tax=Ferrimonas balearica TaxID=44012 RepID=UPI001C566E7F|nr:peptidylprolyl isomerase [Ferrimonas balearica]MBW3137991.1 peptidylprolyl isomerase [Ferrimonas balearica]MBW3164443.1 peptidylprolyl isomerase [Ferrimonas balearica]MBY6094431.1 peptidylprolyl isomerase [Ferrimonas balearica]MBY6105068.1 peptidylprolyl isomerase [Ferrimonas balearica]MBY6224917.1 peptidylprolyl isomerase [Ferrimonas balearica]
MTRALTLAFGLLFASLVQATDKDPRIQPGNLFPKVQMETSLGTLVVELDRSRAELTVDNFLLYVVDGAYNNSVFHRVIGDFVVQGGGYDRDYQPIPERDPVVNESGNGLSNSYGTIAMARTNEPHSATNQFYFNVADNERLDPSSRRWGYAVFGEVVEGSEVLESMAAVETGPHDDVPGDTVPVTPMVLIKATLLPE